MGGFHLFEHGSQETSECETISHEEDTSLHPLSADNLNKADTTIDIDFSSFTILTEAEIKDKGKSDWLAKSLVLLQTSWFVMQCIARAINHLPVTHLEIVTLAYAALNFVIYIFWWDKPLNVNRPVRVFRKSDPNAAAGGNQPQHSGGSGRIERRLTLGAIGNSLKTLFTLIVEGEDDVNLSREDKVPSFWADDRNDAFLAADAIALGAGVCFGAIHCIAWHFSFPTYAELLMWRISSVAMIVLPVYILLMFCLGYLLVDTSFRGTVLIFGPISGGILYILARAVTLVLAFTSLGDLPHGAYETVHWTTFIPHV